MIATFTCMQNMNEGPIGIFDSGYGGLTVLKDIRALLPEYNYIYLGDNARAPYGSRSFDLVHNFTLEAVKHLFAMGCRLVILACNTASAKALRSIQQQWLAKEHPSRRVLGVIRPTVEMLPTLTSSGHVGLMATAGTVASHSYKIETERLWPQLTIAEQECPLLVPLIENGEGHGAGAKYFIKKYTSELLRKDVEIDAIILGCTHYPIIEQEIREQLPENVKTISQGKIVAKSLQNYLFRHPEMERRCAKGGKVNFYTTEDASKFETLASLFYGEYVEAQHTSFE